jgi:hypothetical protein
MADIFQGAEFAAETAFSAVILGSLGSVQSAYQTLAQNYYNMYQTQRQFYFNVFQNGGELPFANEQFGIAFYSPDYLGVDNIGYFPPGAFYLFNQELSVRGGFLGATIERYNSRYAPGSGGSIENSLTFNMETANIADSWIDYMNRYEEHKRDVFNERRWANRMGSLSFGVKEAYTVEQGLATSFYEFDQAQGNLVSSENSILNGLATFVGDRVSQRNLRNELGTVPNYQTSNFLTNVLP